MRASSASFRTLLSCSTLCPRIPAVLGSQPHSHIIWFGAGQTHDDLPSYTWGDPHAFALERSPSALRRCRVRSVLHAVADRGGVPIESGQRDAKALGRCY